MFGHDLHNKYFYNCRPNYHLPNGQQFILKWLSSVYFHQLTHPISVSNDDIIHVMIHFFFMISHWHDITYRTQSLSGNHGFNNGSANSLIAVTNINQKHELHIQILFFQPKLNTTNRAWFAWYYQTFWFSLVYQYSPPGDIEVDTRPLSE